MRAEVVVVAAVGALLLHAYSTLSHIIRDHHRKTKISAASKLVQNNGNNGKKR